MRSEGRMRRQVAMNPFESMEAELYSSDQLALYSDALYSD